MATKEEKQAAKAAKAEQSSQKSTSDQTREGEVTKGDTIGESTPNAEEATKDAVQQSEEVAKKGGSKPETVEVNGEKRKEYELPEGYDPFNDPVVPSSDVAQQVATELKGLGESPTLKALHDARKDDDK